MRLTFLLIAVQCIATSALLEQNDILATSDIGRRLLSKSRFLNNNNKNNNNNYDMTWAADYSLQFRECHSLVQVAGGNSGNGGNGGGKNDKNGGSKVYTQHIVTFSLCPTGKCTSTTTKSCTNGAQYVVSMADFVDAYTEAKTTAHENACEQVRQNCACDDDATDDEACEAKCYSAAGLSNCVQEEGEEKFEIQQYLECSEVERENNNNNNNNNGNNYNYNRYSDDASYYRQYFIGPYCSTDGSSIQLGLFLDQGCSVRAPQGTYESMNYGASLPYSTQSLVERDCISCLYSESDDDANGAEVTELCQTLYQQAGRCEKNLNTAYPDTNACDYINDILPRLDKASRSIGSYGVGSSGDVGGIAPFFAWVFFLSTVALGGYVYYLNEQLDHAKLGLASQEVKSGVFS